METRIIPTNPQYTVDEVGNVTRIEGGRNKTQYVSQCEQMVKGKRTGYMYVSLLTKQHTILSGEVVNDYPCFNRVAVHRLVCMAFNGMPTEDKPWVNHKDGNKANNHFSNLEWTSISQNIQHAHDTGLVKKRTGADHWRHGTKATKATRAKMAAKKIGENHPKFKGWYVVNGRKYASSIEAARELGTYPKAITRMCFNRVDGCYFLDKSKLL